MSKLIGLTGGIASGKTSVAKYLQEQGLPVIDSDQISRQVVASGQEGLTRIEKVFGSHLIEKDGTLNRKLLGEEIFSDSAKRNRLNSLLHPLIFEETERQVTEYKKAERPFIIIDMPLLYEVNYQKKVDLTLVVYVDQVTQIQRLMKRNDLTKEQAQSRINSQMSLEEKKNLADDVIDNSGTWEKTQVAIDQWLKRL